MSRNDRYQQPATHVTEGARPQRRPLFLALAITTAFLIVEVIGGFLTNSLALLADAGHMLTDVAALALSLFAIWLARRSATPERSYGFARAEVLAALVNAATLVVISISIFWEAIRRLGATPEVESGPMLLVAIAGLAANAASAWVLSRGGHHHENLNMRGAFLHVVGDMLGSAGAIVAALVMLGTGWYLADPILSAGIGLLILWSAWHLLRESVDVLLEATPKGIKTRDVRERMLQVECVIGVHDLHIWTVTSGLVALSAHVQVTDSRAWRNVLTDLVQLLRDEFGIVHATLQPEAADGAFGVYDGCSLDTPEGRRACCVATEGAPARATAHQH